MIVHSKQFFTTPLDKKQIQPNAVDIRVSKIYSMKGRVWLWSEYGNDDSYTNSFKNEHRVKAELEKMCWCTSDMNSTKMLGWKLEPGVYEFETADVVKIPEGICGWVVARSTLNRNGIFITSGLYDSGYNNIVGGVLHVNGGPLFVSDTARIGQFITMNSETAHMYAGQYNRDYGVQQIAGKPLPNPEKEGKTYENTSRY